MISQVCKYVCYGLGILLAVALVAVFVARAEVKVERKAREIAEQNLAAYTSSAAAVITERLQAQAATKVENTRKTKETVTAYETRIDLIHAAYAERVRAIHADRAAAPAAVPGTAVTTLRADVAPLDDATAQFLGDLRACEIDREKLAALQQWIMQTR